MAAEVRDNCEALAIALANAKQVEEEAKAARIKAEEELAAALGGKEIGSSSFKCGRIGVTVKRGFNYKIEDVNALASINPDLIKTVTKTELNERMYEELRASNTETFVKACEFVTATPKKTSITLKL